MLLRVGFTELSFGHIKINKLWRCNTKEIHSNALLAMQMSCTPVAHLQMDELQE
jgi:hypothetical protein